MTDPEADRRTWTYEAYPTAAAHELLKLIGRCRELLPRVTCPLLAFYSTRDSMVKAEGARRVVEEAASEEAKLVTLHNSGHVLTVDSEWRQVAERTYDFVREWA
jgi:carboxylesterase